MIETRREIGDGKSFGTSKASEERRVKNERVEKGKRG